MKKHSEKKKWMLLIILIWVVFLAIVCIGCSALQRANVYKKAKTDLIDQAEIISKQFPSLVDTNFYSRAALLDRQLSEVKAISYVLESYDDISQANAFLENVVSTTEVKNLWIYDRNGNAIFKNGNAPEEAPEADEICYLLDSRDYELIESDYNGDERYLTATYFFESEKSDLFWGVNGQWLVYAEDDFSNKLKEVVKFADWESVLQDISIGRDGSVLAVSEINDSVLSYSDPSFIGKPVEDLNIRLAGDKSAANVAQLAEAFSSTGEVKEIEVNSVPNVATKMNIDNDLFLMMFPTKTIEEEVTSEILILMVPLTLITGIGILYVFFLAGNDPKQSKDGSRKKRGLAIPFGKVKVFTLIAVLLMLVFSLYLETQLVYGRMFRYTSSTAEDVLQKKITTGEKQNQLQEILQDGVLEKCKIARSGIQHAAEGKLDRAYVTNLANCLNVSYLYMFNNEGTVSLTNAPYDGFVIEKDSPFHELLEGRQTVILEPKESETSEETRQALLQALPQDVRQEPLPESLKEMWMEVGVTMIDENNLVEGAIVIEDNSFSVISEDLSIETVFERVFLKDNTIVMAINSEDMTVQYFAEVDGSLLVSDPYTYDNAQVVAADLGVDEKIIKDNFNGEMFAINNQYFSSIRRYENTFLIVLRPLVFLEPGSIISIAFMTIFTLLFFVLLLFVIRRFEKVSDEDSEPVDDPLKGKEESKHAAPDINKDTADDDMLTLLKQLANNDKYAFEERWPSDGRKWRDKTPMEKFATTVKLICIAVLALIALYVILAGEKSLFYYCFNGEWSSGINLYSITSSIITIILLVLLGEVIHKVLYLIARATKRKGETICSLLNSFKGYILFIAGVIVILGIFGVDITAISLTAGVAGIIFGIGCQNIVSDIIAGIIMAFEGVGCVGDFVSYNNKVGTIQSIGVRTTKLKWFSEVTIIRNNEFKNYILMPGEEIDRVSVYLYIDLKESLSRVESVIDNNLPRLYDALREIAGDDLRLKYRGVQEITDSAIKLRFAVFCQGMYFSKARRGLTRELLLMCERNEIRLAMPQIVINQRQEDHKDPDSGE